MCVFFFFALHHDLQHRVWIVCAYKVFHMWTAFYMRVDMFLQKFFLFIYFCSVSVSFPLHSFSLFNLLLLLIHMKRHVIASARYTLTNFCFMDFFCCCSDTLKYNWIDLDRMKEKKRKRAVHAMVLDVNNIVNILYDSVKIYARMRIRMRTQHSSGIQFPSRSGGKRKYIRV